MPANKPEPVDDETVAVVGLGYVGLPLALAFGRVMTAIGFDIRADKIAQLRKGQDETGEVEPARFAKAERLRFTDDPALLRQADYVIVAVPTPITDSRQPDLAPLVGASTSVGRNLKNGAIVIYESTVYPGLTEEICQPILERESGLRAGSDFFLGYSPERINPGDKEHTLDRLVKVVSAQDTRSLDRVAALYERVVNAGVFRAQSIRVAEAAKVIENTQRDINIALVNELAIIFNRLGLDTHAVLAAAGTKWNFLRFQPGLVGGHCIGVDPYYLTYKAELTGYHPEIILAGRRINDGMGKYIAEQTVKRMIIGGRAVKGSKVLVLGLTFKENCRDIRNTRVTDIVRELESYGAVPVVCDPRAAPEQARLEFGIQLAPFDILAGHDAIVAAVAHQDFLQVPAASMRNWVKSEGALFVDVKSAFDQSALTAAGFEVWRL